MGNISLFPWSLVPVEVRANHDRSIHPYSTSSDKYVESSEETKEVDFVFLLDHHSHSLFTSSDHLNGGVVRSSPLESSCLGHAYERSFSGTFAGIIELRSRIPYAMYNVSTVVV